MGFTRHPGFRRAAIALLALAGTARATDYVWVPPTYYFTPGATIRTGDFDWSKTTSWTPAGVPLSSNDTVYIGPTQISTNLHTLGTNIILKTLNMIDEQNATHFIAAGHALTFDNGGDTAVWRKYRNAVTPTGVGSFSLHVNSDLVLNSDLQCDWMFARSVFITNAISGEGGLTFNYSNSNGTAGYRMIVFADSAPNTYGGGTWINDANEATRGNFRIEKNGAFGTGDVTLNDRALVTLTDRGATDDMIHDSAALRLTNVDTFFSRVTLNADVYETIGGLYFNGAAQALGTWGSSSSAADHKDDNYFTGTGVLNVIPEPFTAGLLGLGLSLYGLRRRLLRRGR